MLSIPEHAFTGLSTKAVITLTTSATIDSKVADGGTVQAIANELAKLHKLSKIPIRNLVTGEIDHYETMSEMTIGDLIFWYSVQEVISTPPEVLREVKLLVIREPGKSRCVTKGHACLKIILDVINKICSWPLKKGVRSSQSGMSLEAHGWEFFKSFFDKFEEPNLFDVVDSQRTVTGLSGEYSLTEVYRDVFVSSTDYETATDYMSYEVASYVGGQWMTRCGIPPVLRGIVHETCYKPRKILFDATGPIKDLGDPTGTEGVRSIITSRGVLMGDPLTKPCLHIINVLARIIAEKKDDPSFYATVRFNRNAIRTVLSAYLEESLQERLSLQE